MKHLQLLPLVLSLFLSFVPSKINAYEIDLRGIGRPAADTFSDPAVIRYQRLFTEYGIAQNGLNSDSAANFGRIHFGLTLGTHFSGIDAAGNHWGGQPGHPVILTNNQAGKIPNQIGFINLGLEKGLLDFLNLELNLNKGLNNNHWVIGVGGLIGIHDHVYKKLPGLAVKVHGNRLLNAKDIDIITFNTDLIIDFSIQLKQSKLKPYINMGMIFIHGNSEILDETPLEINDPADQVGGTQGSLYSFPTLDWRDNTVIRLGLGLDLELEHWTLGVQTQIVENSAVPNLMTTGLNISWKI